MWHRALQAIGALVALQAIQIPAPQGYVNDFANVIPAATEQRIAHIIDDVKAKSGGEIVVVTMPDIGGQDVGTVALQIGRDWKVGLKAPIGSPARNAGVVVLLVPRETNSSGQGAFSIQVGQGAEGFITDADAGRIRREATDAYLRQTPRDYGAALELTTLRLAQLYARNFHFTLDTAGAALPQPVAQVPSGGQGGIPPIVLLIIFVVIVALLSGGSRRRGCGGCIPIFIPFGGGWGGGRGGWGGGGFGGGGFGGGGGGFGGFGGGGGFSGGGSSGSF